YILGTSHIFIIRDIYLFALTASTLLSLILFFSTSPPPTHLYTLSLHDALPISSSETHVAVGPPTFGGYPLSAVSSAAVGADLTDGWQRVPACGWADGSLVTSCSAAFAPTFPPVQRARC